MCKNVFLLGAFLSLWSISTVRIDAQQTNPAAAAPRLEETLNLAERMLSQGDAPGASLLAQELVGRYPDSAAALGLAIRAEVARAGATAALDVYERWKVRRPDEDTSALHQIARATLRELARSRDQPSARIQAVEALAAAGDADVVADVQTSLASGDAADVRAAAAAGHADALATLIADFDRPGTNKQAAMRVLGRSGSALAIAPLKSALQDPNPINRAGAANALAELAPKINPAQIAPDLKPLITDPVFAVRLAAATALFALKDPAGAQWLNSLASSDQPAIRLAAAQAMRTKPDQKWMNTVRALLKDPNPEIRRQAAELLAAHEPDTAREALEPLLKDANPAEREAASDSYLRHVATDIPTLRTELRSADSARRVRAAARLLDLTR